MMARRHSEIKSVSVFMSAPVAFMNIHLGQIKYYPFTHRKDRDRQGRVHYYKNDGSITFLLTT